jgi:hypothetical protein
MVGLGIGGLMLVRARGIPGPREGVRTRERELGRGRGRASSERGGAGETYMILSYLHLPFLLHSESPKFGSQRVFRVYDRRVQDVHQMYLQVSKGLIHRDWSPYS